MSNTDQVSVPLPAELREYVRQVAEVEERSQAAVIRSRSGGGLMATAAEQTFIAAVGRAEQTRQTAKASAFTTNAVAGAIPPANLAARMAKYWWVNHSQTFHQEIDGGYLWSPKTEASGARSQCCAILNRFEAGRDVLRTPNFERNNFEAEHGRGRLNLAQSQHRVGTSNIGQDCHAPCSWYELAQKFKSSSRLLARSVCCTDEPVDVTSWSRQVCDQTSADWIACCCEDDWDY